MSDTGSRRRTWLAGGGAVLAAALLATGCGSDSTSKSGSGGDANAKITLTVNLFSDFGYKDLYAQYHKLHPNITIKENRADLGAHHQNLHAHLVAGSGTADIEAIEIGQVAGFQSQASKFVNFLDEGVDKNQWVPSKTAPASSRDGSSLFGLGTDMGGMALCYRADLFKKAGLPTDRAAVSSLVANWDSYFATGKQFLAKSPDKKVKWFDAGSNVFSAMTAQAPQAFYDADGKVIADSNPAVKQAFDAVAGAIKDGESAGIAAFTPAWDTGFRKSQFATVTCPAWMSYEFKANPPADGGKWDIATIPGGGGNWGGSYLTVPKQGKHTKAAVELAKWLTAPAQEAWLFKNKGFFPSDQALWSSPDIANLTDPMFSGAPTGKIFSESAKNLKPQPLGPHGADIGNIYGNALVSVEQGKAGTDKAWSNANAEIKNIGE
ncbi:cellobiose transport system substrate-binding protein [Actinacidiphila alni]|uniref:Cellobiose transport system substrate-binding protein n=1 Tax=Actinacidiphila alni TaxID=380248 RepID=A0A1I1XRK4_9ACTN|nr:extracellular solute-binding protein [Actinacidiphila alni]SFE09909.1 cellobiose transport system substrate-binding protein [Actinacidiphila alni]